MAEYTHSRASATVEVSVSADQFVEAAADWVSHVSHFKNFPFKLGKCVYAEGSSTGKLPCTRLLYVDKTGMTKAEADAYPEYFRETLLKVDREARALFYMIEGEAIGMRNYFACKEVDALGSNRCRVTISSRFDLNASVSSEQHVTLLEEVYRVLIAGVSDSAKNQAGRSPNHI